MNRTWSLTLDLEWNLKWFDQYGCFLQNVLHLVKIMLLLPISAAVCERGFSCQKRIKSDNRANLHTDTVEDLIRISVEGPELMDYDASQDVRLWFSQGKRTRRPNYKSWPLWIQLLLYVLLKLTFIHNQGDNGLNSCEDSKIIIKQQLT